MQKKICCQNNLAMMMREGEKECKDTILRAQKAIEAPSLQKLFTEHKRNIFNFPKKAELALKTQQNG